MTDYEPTLDHDSIHPAQWTHFKSKKDKKEESKHQSSKDKQAAFRTENETIFGAAPDPKKVSAPTSHHPHHTVTHPTATHHPEHPPLVIGQPSKKRRWPRLKFTKNAPLLIVLASLGIILIAMGAYMFREQISEQISEIPMLNLDQTNKISITKPDLKNNLIIVADGYLQRFDLGSNQLDILEEYTAAIPGQVYSVKPNRSHDIFLVSSSESIIGGAKQRHYVLNLKTQELALLKHGLFANEENLNPIDAVIWNPTGTELLASTIDGLNEAGKRQYKLFTIDPINLKTTDLTIVAGDKVSLLYFDESVIAYELKTETISTVVGIDDEPEEINTTTTYQLVSYDLKTKQSAVLETDSASRLPSMGGSHYALKTGNTLNFVPYNSNPSLSDFKVNLPLGATSAQVVWSPGQETFALNYQLQDQQQLVLYSNRGIQLAEFTEQIGTGAVFAETETIIIFSLQTQAGSEEKIVKSKVDFKQVNIQTGEEVSTGQFTAIAPTIWALIK